MIRKHQCLDGDTERLGDSWDCPKCRVALLDSFRTSPEAPETGLRTAPNLFHPHLMVPPEHARTVPLDPDGAEHTVAYGTQPYTDGRAGGLWRVVCNCGWRKEGRYGLDARQRADQVAREWAQTHVEDYEAQKEGPDHVVIAEADAFHFQSGGWYKAICACGWEARGLWTDHQGQAWAREQAEAAAEAHRKNPEDTDQ